MKVLKLALFLPAFAFLFTSCEKEKEPIDVTKKAYLNERAWRLYDYKYTLNADEELPLYEDGLEEKDPCTYDDFFYFATKSDGFYSDYFIRCDAALPEQTPFFYTVSADDQNITVYTNPDDMMASVLLNGRMETPHIDSFTVYDRFWDETTETFHQHIYKFAVTYPTDI